LFECVVGVDDLLVFVVVLCDDGVGVVGEYVCVVGVVECVFVVVVVG